MDFSIFHTKQSGYTKKGKVLLQAELNVPDGLVGERLLAEAIEELAVQQHEIVDVWELGNDGAESAGNNRRIRRRLF